ncbi:hypothetical protein AB0A69_27885 [Streptomyces sp. NPDC045431]|uniref:endonuclease domain-containing protein n=1 Tax=Streptomyces sp. NPDC045431 TaxID=3155613 RepID=UPI0033F8B6A1
MRGDLAGLATQDVLLTRHAVAAGRHGGALSRVLRGEGWQPVVRGAWARPGTEVTARPVLRALQMLQPRLVVSHRSAAALHLVELLRYETEFTNPRAGTGGRRRGVRVHRVPLREAEVVVRRGLRATAAVRTVGDLLRTAPPDEAVVAADSALSHRTVGGVSRPPLTTIAALETEVAADGPGPRRGSATGRRLLRLAEPRCGSPAETLARLRMHEAGLRPEPQAWLRTPRGRVRRVDFLFRRERLVVEIEGYAFHSSPGAHRNDLERSNDLASCPEVGTILRYPASVVFRTPDRMVAEIREALAAALSGTAT